MGKVITKEIESNTGDVLTFTNNITVNIVRAMAADEYVIQAAQVSVKGENEPDMTPARAEGMINHLMKNRHGSPFEHTFFTFAVTAPLFVIQEMLRHRVGTSFNQESGRYAELKPVFYIPYDRDGITQVGRPGHYSYENGTEEQSLYLTEYLEDISITNYTAYKELLGAGISRELARTSLPHNIFSSIYFTVNARSLMNFLSLRVEDEDATFVSHPMKEIQVVAEGMEKRFQYHMPLTHKAFVNNGRVAP